MSRYIDANAVVWEIEKDKCGLEDYDSALEVAIAEIKTFKTADVVEVVRCKNCKFQGHIQRCPFGKRAMPHANGYCCYGERREDAEIH